MKFLLVYPPLQFRPEDTAKPDGSLALPYLAGALRGNGYEVTIYDACAEDFWRKEELDNGLIRIGASSDTISETMSSYDIIGITSIFTAQTTRVIEMVKLAKKLGKFVILGGVNARSLAKRFFDVGADVICNSESEGTIVQLANALTKQKSLTTVHGINSTEGFLTMPRVETNLDNLPMPAWDLLPLERYWDIARPHAGAGGSVKYASLMTSRGCPFKCEFCHISKELEGMPAGNIKQLRLKSEERVSQEFDRLQELGVEYVFLEDDSLLAKKARAISIFEEVKKRNLKLSDVNGVNLVHMFKKHKGELVVDRDLIGSMVEAGFEELTLPFESGSQRVLDRYATGKLDLSLDLSSMIKVAKELGLKVGGNYTFGYPDETYDELSQTLLLAQKHMYEGLDRVNLFVIQPFPGTVLYDQAIREGLLNRDFDPDMMNWMYPSMKNTVIHPEVLRYVSKICWRMLNNTQRIESVAAMRLA